MADININTNKIINFGNLSQYHTNLKNWISGINDPDTGVLQSVKIGSDLPGSGIVITNDETAGTTLNSPSGSLQIGGSGGNSISITGSDGVGIQSNTGVNIQSTASVGIQSTAPINIQSTTSGVNVQGVEFVTSGTEDEKTAILQQTQTVDNLRLGDNAGSGAYIVLTGNGDMQLNTGVLSVRPKWNGEDIAILADIPSIPDIPDIPEAGIGLDYSETSNAYSIKTFKDTINNTSVETNPVIVVNNSGLKANLSFAYDDENGVITLNGATILTPSDWQNQLLKIVFADTLVTASADYANTLFVVPSDSAEDAGNLCDEYICKENQGVWYWELFGTASIDFTYATNDDINSLFTTES